MVDRTLANESSAFTALRMGFAFVLHQPTETAALIRHLVCPSVHYYSEQPAGSVTS